MPPMAYDPKLSKICPLYCTCRANSENSIQINHLYTHYTPMGIDCQYFCKIVRHKKAPCSIESITYRCKGFRQIMEYFTVLINCIRINTLHIPILPRQDNSN